MPQHDYNIANAPGATVRSDINNALSAIFSQNSGPSQPTTTTAYMIWLDTTTLTHKQRNSSDSAWIILHKIGSKIVHKDDLGANIPSGATVDLATATGKTVTITGSGDPIMSFGVVEAGFNFTIIFSSTPIITHNVTSLILPGGGNITAAVGDVMQLVSLGSGNWKVTNYTRADGESIIFTPPPDASDTVKGIAEVSTQADVEAATELSGFVTPGRQKFHPGSAKASLLYDNNGTPNIVSSYNISSVTDQGTGRFQVIFNTDFSNSNYVPGTCVGGPATNGGFTLKEQITGSGPGTTLRQVGAINMNNIDHGNSLFDSALNSCIFFGDQ